MSWTDERIDLLKQLWSDGLSASQIAGQMGGVTRNAVIGKVHRLKLEGRVKVVEAVVDAEQPEVAMLNVAAITVHDPVPLVIAPQPVRHAVHGIVGATALKIDTALEIAEGALEIAEDVVPPRPSGEVVPISRNLTLVQLSDRTCKWPLGDPLSADFRFCGNHSGDASPYCRHHARIAFQSVVERRRMR